MVDRGGEDDLGAGGAQLLKLHDQMLQLGHTAAADLDQKGVGACNVVALQHLPAALQKRQQLLPVRGGDRKTDQGIHIDLIRRAVQQHGIAIDDAVGLHLVDAAGHGGTGQRNLLCDLLDWHAGVLHQQTKDLAI